jgi:hypothetical protein
MGDEEGDFDFADCDLTALEEFVSEDMTPDDCESDDVLENNVEDGTEDDPVVE